MSTRLTITIDGRKLDDCETALLVPEQAIKEAGYIKMFSLKDSGHAKHEYHALAQMAYFQFQDDELEIEVCTTPMTITLDTETLTLENGLLLVRAKDGSIRVAIHGAINQKKILEAGYRYCTRWVRLDI
jgi:hypothetical protein